nr:hypothetical protein BaRGS_006201 [Batillaria attramentaria]
MEQAAWEDTTFKFSTEFHSSVPGHLVNGIRKDLVGEGGDRVRQPFVFGDVDWNGDHSYWSTRIDGNSIPVGVSSFQPKSGDTVVFQLQAAPADNPCQHDDQN